MVNDLTNSQHDRQNILNNRYALEKVEEHLGLGGMTCKKNLSWQWKILLFRWHLKEVTGNRFFLPQ